MLLVDAHNAANNAEQGVRAGARSSNPYSLEGLPRGNAGDLIDVARKVNGVRDTNGAVIK